VQRQRLQQAFATVLISGQITRALILSVLISFYFVAFFRYCFSGLLYGRPTYLGKEIPAFLPEKPNLSSGTIPFDIAWLINQAQAVSQPLLCASMAAYQNLCMV
jgi:hypothetical protein